MKLLLSLCLAASVPALAAQPSPAHANNRTVPKSSISKPVTTATIAPVTGKTGGATPPVTTPAPAPAAPAPKPAPAGSLTLNAYIAALATGVPLSKDEQTDVKTYYLDDGSKLQDILNNDSLSPFDQSQQIDALRNARNTKIEALLGDATRDGQFLKVEGDYRVALVELAAQGGLAPTSTLPKVPEPTATTPAQAEKPTPGIQRQDAVPGT